MKPGKSTFGVSVLASLAATVCLLAGISALLATVWAGFFLLRADAGSPLVLERISEDPRQFAHAAEQGYSARQSLLKGAGHFCTLWWRWHSLVLLLSLIVLGTIPPARAFEAQVLGGALAVRSTVRAIFLAAGALAVALILEATLRHYVSQVDRSFLTQRELILLSPRELQEEIVATTRAFRLTLAVLEYGCSIAVAQAAFLLYSSWRASWFMVKLRLGGARRG